MQKLTAVKKDEDIAPVYKLIVDKLNEVEYNNKLSEDPSILIAKE